MSRQLESDPQRLNDMLALSHVPRWSIVPLLQSQSVADHTFRVMVIVRELIIRLGHPTFSDSPLILAFSDSHLMHDAIVWAMFHDAGESITGDIPGHIKYDSISLRDALYFIERNRCGWLSDVAPPSGSYGEVIKWLVKVADLIECVSFIYTNRRPGSGHADYVWRYLRDRLMDVHVPDGAKYGFDPACVRATVTRMLVEIEGEYGRYPDPVRAAPTTPAGPDSK